MRYENRRLAHGLAWFTLILPLLVLFWIPVQAVLLISSVLIAAVTLWVTSSTMRDVRVIRYGYFWYFHADLH